MHPVPNQIVIAAFILMGAGFMLTVIRLIRREGSLWGKPSIQPFLFYSGKISMFLCWGLTLARAIFPSFGGIGVPGLLSWAGAILLPPATVVLLVSFYSLGASLRYGLPEQETRLKTTGIYRFSRHPLYLGVFLITLSCIMFFPFLINVVIGLYCIATHYFMILSEEKFLAEKFGAEWREYAGRVRRFL